MTSDLMHFLLVEDDDDHAEIVLRNFRKSRLHNTIDRVVDGADALAYLRAEGRFADRTIPGIILLDLHLPKIDGHEVLAIVKQDPKLRQIPVVVLTTSEAAVDRHQAYNLHANSYLVKPVDFDQFRHMIDELNLYWGVLNTPAVA